MTVGKKPPELAGVGGPIFAVLLDGVVPLELDFSPSEDSGSESQEARYPATP